MKQIRQRLTYANVISSLALFLVLAGGTAFAASQLGKNSVGSKQIKRNAVTAAKLKNNAVTGPKIAANAVTGAKVDESSLGQVPSAAIAGTATTAGSVDGQDVLKVFKLASPGPAPQTIGSFAGFTILSVCDGGQVKSLQLVPPSGADVEMKVSTGGELEGLWTESVQGINQVMDLKGANFRGNASFSGATIGGTVFSGNLGFDDTISFDSTDACAYFGHVIVSS